jgi:zinc protease
MRRYLLPLALLGCLTVAAGAQAPLPPAVPQAPVSAGPAAAKLADILPFRATEATLPNGLRVIVVPTGFPNIVSLQIPVQTGSRNEVEPGRSGFAHFFEHLMYRGTPTFPPARFQEAIVKAGARENAGTGDDVTSYYATFSKDDLEPMLEVYADMFQNLAYSEADFKTESRAILGEYNKNSANPLEKLFEVQRDKAYKVHTYKHTTMGFLRDIEDMPNQYQYSKVFFSRWYRPQFTTVIVAGDVDAKAVLPLVQKHWGGWKTGPASPVTVPQEPPPSGAIYAHVPWPTATLPWVTVGFRAPAFSDTSKDYAAMGMVAALYFGATSDLYKKLVVAEQKVDSFEAYNPSNVDPGLFTVMARLKRAEDAVYVRDEILKTVALARAATVAARRLEEAKSHNRYAVARGLDSTESIAGLLADFAHYARSYNTVNNLYRVYDSLTPADLQQAALKYFTDAGLIVTTLSQEKLPAGIDTLPALATLVPPGAAAAPPLSVPPSPRSLPAVANAAPPAHPLTVQKSATPLVDIKLLFEVGSAKDPAGKEGLAALAAAMVAEAGSRSLTIDQINSVLYPIAGSFVRQVDKEMTTFTGIIHRDNWRKFVSTVLPQLLEPGFRDEDFARLKAAQLNALVEDLRSNNEEELAKERLQANIFRGSPYGHPALGTVSGIASITIEDVKAFVSDAYTRRNLRVGISGNVPDELPELLVQQLGRLPAGTSRPPVAVSGLRPQGMEVEILEKDTRSTAISLGLSMEVTRGHPDFPALSVARAWLGEHRASSGRLYQRIREVRGMNYGDYAYIEAFPGGMFQFFPDPNRARRQQLFEVWIRPVTPENGHMALRLAVHELEQLLQNGMSQADLEQTRAYLMKNVFVMTARQDQQLGYALDSQWYGMGEFTETMRKALATLSTDQVNAAIRRHWSSRDLSVVVVTRDAAALKAKLEANTFSPIRYDGERPGAVLEEDKRVGALQLPIKPGSVRITPIAEVFAK